MATLRSILLEPLLYFVLVLVGLLRIAVDPASRTFGMVAGVLAFAFAGIAALSYPRTRNLGPTEPPQLRASMVKTVKLHFAIAVAANAVLAVTTVALGLVSIVGPDNVRTELGQAR